MKLYFSPGACSLSAHIVAREAALDIAIEKVDGRAKKTETGRDFWTINPKGYVPALELDNGEILTEGPTVLEYLADQRPDAALVPKSGSLARYRVMEMLGYLNSEVHKAYGSLFRGKDREDSEAALRKRYAPVDTQLATNEYLFGNSFTIADAYLFALTGWAPGLKVDISEFANLQAFQTRVAARPAVQAAMRAEGLL